MSTRNLIFTCAAVVLAASLVHAQQKPPAAAAPGPAQALTQTIPIDPQITVGTFPNGLRYYIRTNKKPENRAELRLVVNAGSVLEEDDQRGLAHFVEHMAFNGTKNFPKQDIVKFMESIGMRFGPSVNAFTSFDETVYMLQVPTDKPEVIDRALLVLEDWAHNLTFEPQEIDKERGVIVEEWRLRRGADARMQDKQFPVLLQGSRYADRIPIGKKEIVESFKHERLKQFYADWYRPDLMAVIAVGDFDKAAVQKLIASHFGALPRAAREKPRASFDVPDHPGTLYTVATDKEAVMTTVAVYNKLPVRDPTTVGAYRQQIVEQLYSGMLSRRFAELAQKPDPPFMSAGAGRGAFVRTKEAVILQALVKDGGAERALETLFVESNRVARFGFTATELDRVKRDTLRTMERAYTERDKQESAGFAAEYARNFLQREPIPGIAYEYELYQRFVPQITLEEVNSVARAGTGERSRVVMVNAPERAGVAVPDEARLASVIRNAAAKEITPYVDTVADQKLIDAMPSPGKVVTVAAKERLGLTEWQLSNGARVVLKPTTNKQDEVLVRAFSFGGTSVASDEDFIPAQTASQVVSIGGLGKFSMLELQKMLAGKIATARASIGETDQGLSGSASPKDLETLFQLIYLTFTQPRADQTMFGIMSAQMKTMLTNAANNPERAFSETLGTTLWQNHLRARPLTAELVDRMNLDKSMAFYKDRFGDASGFTFVFVGNFEPSALRPLVEQYIASLPSLNRRETWKDVGMRSATGVVEKTVNKGIEPKSQTATVFTGPFEFTPENRAVLRALESVLDARLRDALREELGGTYGVSVATGAVKVPITRYMVSISFGCNPDRVDELTKALIKDLDSLKANGPTEKQVNDAREALLRDFETNMKQNTYLLSQISSRYMNGEDAGGLLDLPEIYKTLNATMIRDAARAYLKSDNYVKVTLLPEKTEKAVENPKLRPAA